MKRLLAFVLVLGGPASAQSGGWTFAASPYGWLPSLTTSVETADGPVEVESSGSDALSALDFAFKPSRRATAAGA